MIEKNHYQKLDDGYSYGGGAFFTQGSGADYPYLNIKGPLKVIASREQYYENQRYKDFNFRYENAVAHNQGLGFCGFSKIMTKDNIRNWEYIQTYAPYSYGILAEDEGQYAFTG